jgi:hypothetical protein
MDLEKKPESNRLKLLENIDPEILRAAEEVDHSLIDWLLSLSPFERIEWTSRTAAELKGFKRADP